MNPARIVFMRETRSRNTELPGLSLPDFASFRYMRYYRRNLPARCCRESYRAAPSGEPRSIRGRLTGSLKRLMLPAV